MAAIIFIFVSGFVSHKTWARTFTASSVRLFTWATAFSIWDAAVQWHDAKFWAQMSYIVKRMPVGWDWWTMPSAWRWLTWVHYYRQGRFSIWLKLTTESSTKALCRNTQYEFIKKCKGNASIFQLEINSVGIELLQQANMKPNIKL